MPSGGGPIEQITNEQGQSWIRDWSPDSNSVLFAGKKIKSLINQLKYNGTYYFVLNAGNEWLRAGMYFIKLTSEKKQVVEKFSILLP